MFKRISRALLIASVLYGGFLAFPSEHLGSIAGAAGCSNYPNQPWWNGGNMITATSSSSNCPYYGSWAVGASLWVHIPFRPDARQSIDSYWAPGVGPFYRDATNYGCFADPGNRRTFYTYGTSWDGQGGGTSNESPRVDYDAGC